ncbi:hypothetical protein [Ignavigranum ruoffiae]|uniref:hypothetical protein n=1 Tax=Ignavigranum ruoffiae TaxID=89093 RepID=UPI0024AE6FC1|nr:hypothetical protein [Ignavigranum ruoffiae]
MKVYYFNINLDKHGNHVVHSQDCKYLPKIENRKLIGRYQDCEQALRAASYLNYQANFEGCHFCCGECHRTNS